MSIWKEAFKKYLFFDFLVFENTHKHIKKDFNLIKVQHIGIITNMSEYCLKFMITVNHYTILV